MNHQFPIIRAAFLALLLGTASLVGSTQADPLPASLDQAIRQLMETYPEYRSTGKALLGELEAARSGGEVDAMDLQRKVAISHPLLQQAPLLFTTRRQFKKDHHNTATLFQPNEINKRSFQPADYAQERLRFYDDRREQELAVRKAMREGLKVYDP